MISQLYMYIFNTAFCVLILLLGFKPTIAQDIELLDTTAIENTALSDPIGQSIEVESEIKLDTAARKKLLSGVELYIDYGKLLLLWTDFESKYEAGINLRFYERFVLAGEVGQAELNPLKAYDNALYYTVRGLYGRAGIDYYTSYDPKSFYYFGFRYGLSMFEDEGAFLIDSDFWEDFEEGFGSKDLTASWFEIILGTETFVKLGKKEPLDSKSKLLLGWKFRLRFLMDFENREEPRIYSIPGYGRTFDDVVPAVNFYIKYRLGN